MAKRYVLASLAAVAVAVGANAKELQLLDNGIRVTPIMVAPAKMVDGQIVHGDWMPYVETVAGNFGAEHFDAFDPDSTGFPEDEGGCGLGSARWYFGSTYCNGAATADMTASTGSNGAQSTRVNMSWFWYCRGSGTEECRIAVFTGEDFTSGCGGFGGFYSGVLYGFGSLNCNPGGYYYTNIDLSSSGLFHQMPSDGKGVYQIIYLTTNNAPATCAQPMLWGTRNSGCPGDNHSDEQWDDDNPKNGSYQSPDECYSYAYGVCPDPLHATISFGNGTDRCGGGGGCASDRCNGRETLSAKAKAKSGSCQTKGILKGGTAGSVYGMVMPSGRCTQKAANDRGKVVVKEFPSSSGNISVPTCSLTRAVACP